MQKLYVPPPLRDDLLYKVCGWRIGNQRCNATFWTRSGYDIHWLDAHSEPALSSVVAAPAETPRIVVSGSARMPYPLLDAMPLTTAGHALSELLVQAVRAMEREVTQQTHGEETTVTLGTVTITIDATYTQPEGHHHD